MKKSMLLSAILVVFATILNAQTTAEATAKKEMKFLNTQESVIKKEKQAERKALRKLKGQEVSYQSKQEFFRDFGNMPNTKWERTHNFDEVTFTKDGQVLTAFYDFDSKLVGTTSEKSFSDLPTKAQTYISEKYSGYTIGEIVLFDDNENNETDMLIYGRQFDDKDNYFIELKKDNKKIVVRVDKKGEVSYFIRMR